MKKTYKKPSVEVVDFNIANNIMDGDGAGITPTPSINEGVEEW